MVVRSVAEIFITNLLYDKWELIPVMGTKTFQV